MKQLYSNKDLLKKIYIYIYIYAYQPVQATRKIHFKHSRRVFQEKGEEKELSYRDKKDKGVFFFYFTL